ncbi:MAG TPA: DUF721 domain-containing protein [Methylomirabilota bacterium]|nr:DUF721 domain-containing protein [Methylomirabilota bacterium]
MKGRAPRAVGDFLVSAVPALGERLAEFRIRQSWRALVGPEVARRAQPRGLLDGCLQVVVDNSPWLHELTLRAPELTARLHAKHEAVRSLRFTLAALEPDASPPPREQRPRSGVLDPADAREIDAAVATIPDAALAAAARRLLTKAWRSPSQRGAG